MSDVVLSSRSIKLLWYDDVIKEASIDLDLAKVNSWASLRREVGLLTSFIPSKLERLRFQTRDGFDLKKSFEESNFFEGAGILYQEILLVDPENQNQDHGKILMKDWMQGLGCPPNLRLSIFSDFARGVKPELQVQVLEATLSHVRPVTAFMEAIGMFSCSNEEWRSWLILFPFSENSMEAIRIVQREIRFLGTTESYCGLVEIELDYDTKVIEIRDNGRGMTDSDVRNAVNYGRLKNRIVNGPGITDKVIIALDIELIIVC